MYERKTMVSRSAAASASRPGTSLLLMAAW
uniref:Cop2 n=1 Tax=Arundo donax TaxID=35708 RepID=A0A0A9F513_ARUDO